MYAIPTDNHPGDAGDISWSRVEMGVSVAVPMVRHLVQKVHCTNVRIREERKGSQHLVLRCITVLLILHPGSFL